MWGKTPKPHVWFRISIFHMTPAILASHFRTSSSSERAVKARAKGLRWVVEWSSFPPDPYLPTSKIIVECLKTSLRLAHSVLLWVQLAANLKLYSFHMGPVMKDPKAIQNLWFLNGKGIDMGVPQFKNSHESPPHILFQHLNAPERPLGPDVLPQDDSWQVENCWKLPGTGHEDLCFLSCDMQTFLSSSFLFCKLSFWAVYGIPVTPVSPHFCGNAIYPLLHSRMSSLAQNVSKSPILGGTQERFHLFFKQVLICFLL